MRNEIIAKVTIEADASLRLYEIIISGDGFEHKISLDRKGFLSESEIKQFVKNHITLDHSIPSDIKKNSVDVEVVY